MADVVSPSFEGRLSEVVKRTLPKVGPEVADQLRALLSPKSLAVMAIILAAWIFSHGFAVGEIIDGLIAIGGTLAIGLAVFSGLDELFQFGLRTYNARSDSDLEAAASHLAKAIAILGIQLVLAVIFRGRPATRGRPVRPEPPRTPGFRYTPKTVGTTALGAGAGETSVWGDIVFSTRGPKAEQDLVLFHEQVHQFLSPKLYLLRRVRVEMMSGSYTQSSLWRFTEETLAETVAQVRVAGFRQLFSSVKFPVENGYVYWFKPGADPMLASAWGGKGVVPEGAALVAAGLIMGMRIEVWFKAGASTSTKPAGDRPGVGDRR